MANRWIIAALGAPLLTIGAAASLTAEPTRSTAAPLSTPVPNNPVAQQLLAEHNQARDEAGVPRLRWNDRLAHDAQVWAQTLAREGNLRHAGSERNGAGENLWAGSAGYYGVGAMVGAFVEEKRDFVRGSFPSVSRTGNWQDVGHYTQVVWRDTREVGCAMAQGGGEDFLVCRYWPAGNMMGQRPF